MLLWNAVLPDLLHISSLNFWQAAGLFLLCKILFRNFGWNEFGNHRKTCRKPHFRERFMNMSAEEKQKLQEKWKERCQK